MEDSSRQYLEAQVLTATPQKLRLMLIDGAIRFANQTLQLWEQEKFEAAIETLIRCRSILGELLSGIQTEKSDLTRKVATVYLFLLRCLTEAQLKRDRNCLQEVLEVLAVERETWQMVCDQMPTAPVPMNSTIGAPVEILATSEGIGGPAKSAFSFDA